MAREWSASTRKATSSFSSSPKRLPAELFSQLDQRVEEVGAGRPSRHPLFEGGHALQAHAGVDVLGRKGRQSPGFVHVVLVKTRFQYSRNRSHSQPGLQSGRRSRIRARGRSTARSKARRVRWPGRAPEVGAARKPDHALSGDAQGLPQIHGLLVRPPPASSPSKHGDPDTVRSRPRWSGGELPAEPDGAFLEVVTYREVAQHLEERAVAGGEAHPVDIRWCGSTSARWSRRRCGRLRQAQEVGFERLHPGSGQENRGVLVRHQRRAGYQQVALLNEVVKVQLA